MDMMANVANYRIICETLAPSIIGCMILTHRTTILYVHIEITFNSESKFTPHSKETMYYVPAHYHVNYVQFNSTHLVVFAYNTRQNSDDPNSYRLFIYKLNFERPGKHFPIFSYNVSSLFKDPNCFDPTLTFKFYKEHLIMSTGSAKEGCKEQIYKVFTIDDFRLYNNCTSLACLSAHSLRYSDEFVAHEDNLAYLVPNHGFSGPKPPLRRTVNPYVLAVVIGIFVLAILKTKAAHDHRQKYLEDIMRLGPNSLTDTSMTVRQFNLIRSETMEYQMDQTRIDTDADDNDIE